MYILWSRQVGDNFREIFFRIKTTTASWVFKEAVEFKCADSRIWPVFNVELKKTNDSLDFALVLNVIRLHPVTRGERRHGFGKGDVRHFRLILHRYDFLFSKEYLTTFSANQRLTKTTCSAHFPALEAGYCSDLVSCHQTLLSRGWDNARGS